MTNFVSSQDRDENIYMSNAESSAEAARLLDQDRFAKQAMGGLFPEKRDDELATITDVLDVACGPGGWIHEVAYSYPGMKTVGIDLSTTMIEYARALAKVRGLRNTRFLLMDALQPLKFAHSSFDLVNARGAAGFVPTSYWPTLLTEYQRVLRPTGTARLVEVEWGFSNKPGFEQQVGLFHQALCRSGRSNSPSGRHMGMTPMLEYLLHKAGFEQIQSRAFIGDFSTGSPLHESMRQNLAFLFKLSQPLLLKLQLRTQPELDALYEQTMLEMQSNDFFANNFIFVAWGRKPQTTHTNSSIQVHHTSSE